MQFLTDLQEIIVIAAFVWMMFECLLPVHVCEFTGVRVWSDAEDVVVVRLSRWLQHVALGCPVW